MGSLGQHYTVYAPDLLGHGDSAKPAPGYSILEHAKSEVDFMDILGISTAYVVGNSTGATIATEMAASYPGRVNKLVVAGLPVLENDEERAGRAARLRTTLDDHGNPRPFILEELRMWFAHPTEELLTLANETRPKVGPDMMEAPRAVYAFEVLSRLSHISCPTLILYGEKDELRGKEHKLLQGIRDSRLVLLPEAGHIPQLDNPEGFVAAVVDFLH
jgi:pimeloyl-ACP methyl ester carboxylesterase